MSCCRFVLSSTRPLHGEVRLPCHSRPSVAASPWRHGGDAPGRFPHHGRRVRFPGDPMRFHRSLFYGFLFFGSGVSRENRAVRDAADDALGGFQNGKPFFVKRNLQIDFYL